MCFGPVMQKEINNKEVALTKGNLWCYESVIFNCTYIYLQPSPATKFYSLCGIFLLPNIPNNLLINAPACIALIVHKPSDLKVTDHFKVDNLNRLKFMLAILRPHTYSYVSVFSLLCNSNKYNKILGTNVPLNNRAVIHHQLTKWRSKPPSGEVCWLNVSIVSFQVGIQLLLEKFQVF